MKDAKQVKVLTYMLVAQHQALQTALAQVEALLRIVEDGGDDPGKGATPTHDEDGHCLHPADKRVDASTFGDTAPSFFCKTCREMVSGPVPVEVA